MAPQLNKFAHLVGQVSQGKCGQILQATGPKSTERRLLRLFALNIFVQSKLNYRQAICAKDDQAAPNHKMLAAG
jgi:hypothetical protein